MPDFMSAATLEEDLLAVEAQIVQVQGIFVRQGPSGVQAPEADGVIWRIVEEAGFVQVRPERESVDVPGANFSLYKEAIKAQPDIRAFANVYQTPRAILKLLPPDT